MRSLSILLLSLLSTAICYAFAAPTEFKDQINKSDTIIRIVVVSATIIEKGTSFTAIAKCRVITKIKGGESLRDFIFIPCAYNANPDRSPIDLEGDYVVMLNTLEGVEIGHPVSHDSVYPVDKGKIELGYGDTARSVSPEEFRVMIEATSDKKITRAEQGGAGQPASRSESDSKGGDKPQPDAKGRSR